MATALLVIQLMLLHRVFVLLCTTATATLLLVGSATLLLEVTARSAAARTTTGNDPVQLKRLKEQALHLTYPSIYKTRSSYYFL